ncbi:hypothetical protein EJ08DRAFT_733155 [Tothia fuscella]|uniref:NADPH-dependent FMN reductase-like domain-containing protein n=1 Tax=Tothia fuscella TaxID=1048955 RepID=A0A9P4NSQ3_9PEZI|nr:hypothetical protein EJ08DRAFT_733155 [Tothia fuscella]
MSKPSNIAIIITSTRPVRIGPSVAAYIKQALPTTKDNNNTTYTIVDVASFSLPLFDEPILPAMVPSKGQYTKPHTLAWSAAMSSYSGYIFTTPEYNYAVVVSYGIFGGLGASEALVKTLEGMKLDAVTTKVNLPFAGAAAGPDLYAAAGEGKLLDSTTELWDREHKEGLLKAVGELERELAAPTDEMEGKLEAPTEVLAAGQV